MDKLRKRKRRRIIVGSVAAAVLILAAVGAGYYFWFVGLVDAPETSSTTLTSEPGVEPPESTDILVLGCDKRPGEDDAEKSRSDTVMLVHVDKENDYLSILSLPRDLYVDIPGHGMNKLNAAYSNGGFELTEATVEQLTGINVEKVVLVDFQAFSDLTDALGGVYIDVDRRYYNDNPEFELIKISPGYQLLSGADTLDYVRFRHDNEADFGRMLRQQRFLTAMREQTMGWNLVSDFDDAISALFRNIETTLSANEILSLAWWAVRLDSSHIRQVSLIGDITARDIDGQEASVVVATEEAVEEVVDKLLNPPSEDGNGETTVSSTTAGTSTGSASTTSGEIDRSDYTTNLEAIANSGLWKKYAAACPFQLMAPGWLPEDYRYWDKNPAEPGCYDILDSGGKVKGVAMKMVYRLVRDEENTEEFPQYLGLMATTWLDAPAASKGRTVDYNGTTYTIVGTNQRTDHVWWVNNGVLYWVSNTLSYYLSSRDLLKVAESMLVIPTGVAD